MLKSSVIITTVIFVIAISIGFYFFRKSYGVISDNCSASENKKQCWESAMVDILNKKGLASAFDYVADLYDKEPEFAKDCHSYTHVLGQSAYEQFYESKNLEMSPKTAYCGYGFYHGFMETLMQSGKSHVEAKEFCELVDEKLAGYTDKTLTSCYHGIGHGIVDGSDPRAWGDAEAVIAPGLLICGKISDDSVIKYSCATGVFNSLAIALNFNQYNLKPDTDNPYASCYGMD